MKKRSQYDMYRKNWWSMWGIGGFWGFGWSWWFEVDLGDVMDQFFWWWRSSSRTWPQPGEDVQLGLEISFEEAFLWTIKTIKFARKVLAKDIKQEECPTCKWRGRVLQQSHTMFGVMQTQNICPTCQWSGSLYTKDGKKMPGWLETIYEEIEVKVPSAIKDNVYIRYANKGDVWLAWGIPWDLYIHIKIKSSSLYKRNWDDLFVFSDVSIFDLVLGNEISVLHPEGVLSIKIPKWTQITDKIKISKKWFGDKWLFSKRGDMYIIPRVHIPKKLSKEQEKLWHSLQNLQN